MNTVGEVLLREPHLVISVDQWEARLGVTKIGDIREEKMYILWSFSLALGRYSLPLSCLCTFTLNSALLLPNMKDMSIPEVARAPTGAWEEEILVFVVEGVQKAMGVASACSDQPGTCQACPLSPMGSVLVLPGSEAGCSEPQHERLLHHHDAICLDPGEILERANLLFRDRTLKNTEG